jgi:hypothetical protein
MFRLIPLAIIHPNFFAGLNILNRENIAVGFFLQGEGCKMNENSFHVVIPSSS